jgi:SnoaL-like domain
MYLMGSRPGERAASRAISICITTCLMAVLCALATGAASAAVSAAELQNMADQLAIQQLWIRYATALDTMDPDAYASCFTADAMIQMNSGPVKPRAYIESELKAGIMKDAPTDKQGRKWSPVRHVTSNLIVNITGNTATAESYWLEIASRGKTSDGKVIPPTVLNMGHYEDQLVKQNGKWLFTQRVVIADMDQPRPTFVGDKNRAAL